MYNRITSINFLNHFRVKAEFDYNYYLHFTLPEREGTHVIKFNECRKVHDDIFLIQYYEWDNKSNNISNFTGHQMHISESQIVRITVKDKNEYYPSYVIN
ncbi:hypothetical protein SAMN04487936_102150 [Halobacillus dabanensis]|uniref:Uncharacterized protein n=1 Tax=Halobacillus dabanensis TaxID=240302 RepID=A0A1I3RAG2_HALDA|nr:hypothetical protein SAMN04487936_102150 [Halobacillus dabanensis]